MTAGNDVDLNQSVVTRDSAISVTAQRGTIDAASGMGLFAGSGPISETSGATLNTGIASTTGALSLRSTNGGVNVNTAIGDTTGAVNIAGATTVNINQPITNLKTGSNLSITAGTDINVLAQVDGRNGVAGGAATMTAGNNLNVTQPIATNNGAVALTATTGSVTVPTGVENLLVPMQWIVSSGSAPINITSGSNFTLASPVITTGALNITSTNGNVNIAAPIPDTTGAVTITAGNGITVNHDIKSAGQAITLNAGIGGITVNTITDFDGTSTAPVNSYSGNLTLNSVGNVSILDDRGIASLATLTIDTRGQILDGRVGDVDGFLSGRPVVEIFNADQGIASFGAGFANSVTATSSGGSITMSVAGPDKLRITTGTPNTLDCPTCDINLGSTADGSPSIGPDVVLNAGGSVNLSPVLGNVLTITARSGDINFSDTSMGTITATAGRDITVGVDPTDLTTRLWTGGPVTLTAGRNIVANSPIQFVTVPGNTLTLTAGQNVTMNLLQSLGAVNITATGGNVTLYNDIGPHIPVFNPSDLGVASLSISAPAGTAAINMQGARAQGDVTISTGGTLVAAKQITSVFGTVSIFAAGGATLSAVPIGTQSPLGGVGGVSPVISPGPKNLLPTPPGGVSIGGAGLPGLTEIQVAAADQFVGTIVGVPGRPGGVGALASAGGSIAGPGTPSGPAIASATGSSDPGTGEDTASALRAAGQACGEDSGKKSDTGLEVLAPGKKSAKSAGQTNASCPAEPNAKPAAGTPSAAPAPTPAPTAAAKTR